MARAEEWRIYCIDVSNGRISIYLYPARLIRHRIFSNSGFFIEWMWARGKLDKILRKWIGGLILLVSKFSLILSWSGKVFVQNSSNKESFVVNQRCFCDISGLWMAVSEKNEGSARTGMDLWALFVCLFTISHEFEDCLVRFIRPKWNIV